MFSFFKTPFPRPNNNKKAVFWIFFIGIACSLFILIFKPFSIENQTGEVYVYFLIFSLGIVFSVSIYFIEFLIPNLVPRLFKKWNLWKAILWYAFVILFVGGVVFLYKSFLGGFIDFTFKEFLMVCLRVLGISIIVTFFVLGMVSYLSQKQLSVLSANESCLITSQEARPLRLYFNEILYFESSDNYVDIHLIKKGSRSKEVYRSSLKNIENQLVYPVSPIFRCHRQFLININRFMIHEVKSRSMLIKLKGGDTLIPVSKQYAPQIEKLLHTRP